MRLVWDTEATELLNHNSIDYTASPYRLKPDFKIHCIVVKDADTGQKWRFVGDDEIKNKFPQFLWDNATALIAHNEIDYDLLSIKLYCGIDYEICENYLECTLTWKGETKQVEIFDTLVASKTLNPDRYGGHSVDSWGDRLGLEKIDWRAKAIELGLITAQDPKGAEFRVYHPEMLTYCERDVDVGHMIYDAVMAEWGAWPWHGPFSLEQQVRDIVTRQSHRGFWYDRKLAEESVRELDQKMAEIKAVVEPVLPPKPLGSTKLKNFLPPKIQFKKNGEVSAVMDKWIARHSGIVDMNPPHPEGKAIDMPAVVTIYGKQWTLPMDLETPIQTHEPSTVKDTTHIKGWLVSLGWNPTTYKERDLTVDSKKIKLSPEKFRATVERYVEQTLASPFCADRCAELDVKPEMLAAKLLKHDTKRPLKVYTNPTITVGMEKEIDPALLELADKFPHAKLVSEYLTYSHRRNSILGGGQEVWDEDEERDEEDEYAGKGFLAAERLAHDGRIPTPADSCGAATSRFKHRLVANIPRVTSLYGERMRAQFGVNPEERMIQLGYDFASLEARIESHYCWKYDDADKAYCNSLILEKPNDVHTKTANKVAEALSDWFKREVEFKRTPAKNVKYCCSYGGQPKRVAKTIGASFEVGEVVYNAFWDSAKPLALLAEKLKEYWSKTGQKKFVLGIDGRKIPTRSASALINSLFQSAGVICAKRAMVIYDRLLKQHGLYVDFFRDDWRNMKAYVQQLIAYHDECQLEVHKSLVKWKMFKEEAEAKAFKKENAGWSEIGHSKKGYYIGKSIASDLITQAVDEAGKFYKLNVPLGADFIYGRTWGECH